MNENVITHDKYLLGLTKKRHKVNTHGIHSIKDGGDTIPYPKELHEAATASNLSDGNLRFATVNQPERYWPRPPP